MKAAIRLTLALAATALLISPTGAQQYVYPAKGQSADQQKKDEAECGKWATGQTGYDPAKPPPQAAASKPPTTATGTTPGAGVRGAARGAVVGEVVGGDAGTGAAAGAAAARAQSRRQNQAQQQQAAASQQQAQSSAGAGWAKARGACLEGRGYTVK
ncbi:MAG TPA: glycine zipper family protein [Burkholderiales bacterium]|nr:glycine zipper family protein [Burkholderiales bacterium]